MLNDALTKTDDELIMHIERSVFQLDKYLSDQRMKEKFDWLQMLTTIFERILGALGQDHRIATILVRCFSFSVLKSLRSHFFGQIKLPGTVYFDALYEAIRQTDPKTKTYRVQLILQTLKIIERLLAVNPQMEELVSPFLERISSVQLRLPSEDEVRPIFF